MAPAPSRVAIVAPALVLAVTLLAFAPALDNGFQVGWDDQLNFLENPGYRGLGWSQLRWMWTTPHLGHYIPVTWMTLGLDHALWGMNAAGYHLTSLLLHAANALLVYLCALRLFAIARPAAGATGRAVAAAAAALLFAVHPLRVESVAWATERRDVVSGLFALLAVLAYLRAVHDGQPRATPRPGWYAASLLAFVLALLSKSIVVTLPVVLLVLDVYPLRRLPGPDGLAGAATRRVVAEKAPYFVLSVVATGVAFWAIVRGARMLAPGEIGLVERVAISVYSLAFYLWKLLVPLDLSPLYELRLPVDPLAPRIFGAAAFVLALAALAVLLRRRWPALAAAGAVYAITLFPVLGLLQNGPQIAADRYTYLACLGWPLLIGGALLALPDRGPRPWIALLTIVALAAVTLAPLTRAQAGVWRDSVTLWRHAIRLDPANGIATKNLGLALLASGRTAEAHAHFARLRAGGGTAAQLHAFALALQRAGDLEGAEEYYRAATLADPRHVASWNNLGVVYAARGRLEPALAAFTRVLTLQPGSRTACANAREAASRLGSRPAPGC
jgi:tetratricopeptide (TPR) repeat protein